MTVYTASAKKDFAVVGDICAINLDGKSQFTFLHKGTFTGATILMEGSPNSSNGVDGDWYTIQVSSDTATTSSANPLSAASSTAGAWTGSYPWAKWARARLTALTTGTVNGTMVSSDAVLFDGIVATHAVTQSGTWTATTTPVATATATSLESAATTNATLVVGAAASLYEATVSNPTATQVFFKLYNKATAPTVGTDAPIMTIPVPAGSALNLEFGALGKRFSLGIGFALTANAVKTDTTAVGTGVQVHLTRI